MEDFRFDVEEEVECRVEPVEAPEHSHQFRKLYGLVEIREQNSVSWLKIQDEADIADLRRAVSKALAFPQCLLVLWPLDTMIPMRPQDFGSQQLKINKIRSAPIYVSGRGAFNSVPLHFLATSPPTVDEHQDAVRIATCSFYIRVSRASRDNGSERTSVHGVKFAETKKLQKRFRRLEPFDGPDAEARIRRYDGTSKEIIQSFIGTGIIPRLHCEHNYGPLAPSCRACSILFVTEWLWFARHIYVIQALMFGQQVHAMFDHWNHGHVKYLENSILHLNTLLRFGMRIGYDCPLAKSLSRFIQDFDVEEYMRRQVCEEVGLVDDIESFFQILEFLVDIP